MSRLPTLKTLPRPSAAPDHGRACPHRDLVEQRGWITEADYKEGLALSQLMPGPLGAAVIGIIAMSAYKLTTKSIAKRKLLWAIYLVSGAITVITESEIGPRLVERRCRTTAGRWH